jgi:VWFA-related protein
MPHQLMSSVLSFAVAGAAVSGAASIGVAAQEGRPTVYVSATDKSGNPVTDLDVADFELKAGGKRLEVVKAGPAQAPLRIALLVSDGGTGAFQMGLARFMQKLSGRAQFALVSVIVQPETVVDYTGDVGALTTGLRRLGARGSQRGAQLMEAIQDATKTVRSEAGRSAIVVVRVGAEATTQLSGNDVREDLRKSGAILYVLSTVGAQRMPQSQARTGISNEQAQMQDDEVVSGALNLGQVLGDGSKESGGRHDQIVSTTLVPAMEQVADELLNQYAITVVVPDGVKATDKVSISSKRKGVTLRTRSRLRS